MMLAKRLRRWVGYCIQLHSDLEWHMRFGGSEMPTRIRRMAEQARLLVTNGIDGEDYYNHGLFRTGISFAEKSKFLGYYMKSRYFDTINPPVYDILARDKVLSHLLCTSLQLPVPDLIAVTSASGQPVCGRRLDDLSALAAYLMETDSQELFFKPGGSSFGEGALSLGRKFPAQNAWRRLPGNGTIQLEEALDHVQRDGKMRRFLIQKRLRPHPVLAEIVPDVCSTIRIMTYTNTYSAILGAALRLGSGREPTDNLSGGGVVVSVNLETGVLGDVVSIDSGIPERMSAHPLTGIEVSGKQVPYWPAIIDLVKSAASKLSFMRCIGWDIGVTDNGPIIIEINTRPRCRPIQVANDCGLLVGTFRDALIEHNGTVNSGLNLREY